MTWTAPMTAIAGSVFTAAQFNTFVRDNLNECPAAKATAPGSHFITAGTNQVVERIPVAAVLNVAETTTATSFADAPTPGPIVTAVTGSTALIAMTVEINNSAASSAGTCGVDISGATTEAPDDNFVLRQESSGGSEFQRCTAARLHTGLTPGTNVFKIMYKTSGAGTFALNKRELFVIPY